MWSSHRHLLIGQSWKLTCDICVSGQCAELIVAQHLATYSHTAVEWWETHGVLQGHYLHRMLFQLSLSSSSSHKVNYGCMHS